MFRIEKDSNECSSTVRLSGRIDAAHIDSLRAELDTGCAHRILDLREVTLVDLASVQFLSHCENEGIELAHCPPYVREWIIRERAEEETH